MSQSSPFSFLFLIPLILKPPLLIHFHILLFHFSFFIFPHPYLLRIVFLFHFNIPLILPHQQNIPFSSFFTSSSSSSSFPFPSTIGLLPGSWLIKGNVTALTVFLITFQVLTLKDPSTRFLLSGTHSPLILNPAS